MKIDKSNPIYFYSTKDEFGAFSNFSKYPIVYNNKKWKTSEAAYQAEKFPTAPDVQDK